MRKKNIAQIMLQTLPLSTDVMEWSEMVLEEGSSSPYGPPKNQERSSSLPLPNPRSKASLHSRRGGVSKSENLLNGEACQATYFNSLIPEISVVTGNSP